MAGYTRNDTSNNIATGNVINAADLDGEFDALVAAFHASTGHTHDGTAANGAPITKIGPAQDLVISTGAITPKTDNTVDLGSSSFEFKDLYIDGTANIDALVADTADINAGTIDGVTLGTNSAVTEAQIDNININGNTISSTDTNGNISLVPNGTGDVILTADTIQVGDSNTDVTVTTNGTGDLIFNTNAGTNSGVIRIYDGANGNIALTPNGTGEVDISKVDIDSGAIDGTAIGANSASTGAFTTLSASSTVTLSGGTADGVLYLNGSKVATSGSALTFDTARLSFIKASNGRAWSADGDDLFAIENSTSANADFRTSTTGATYLMFSDTDARARGYVAYLHNSDNMPFAVAGAEAMRLTSTGLGIGTTSPAAKLEVSSSDLNSIFVTNPTTTGTTTGSGVGFKAYNGSSVTQSAGIFLTSNTWSFGTYSANQLSLGSDGTGGLALRTSNSAPITFFTGGATAGVSTERMRLDSSGNLGLGVTPSAWGGSLKALQVGGSALSSNVGSAANTLRLSRNMFYSDALSSFAYIASGSAAYYSQDSAGGHQFFTAPSGTAGNAITFTQAMTLDASGNLGIGTTSPAYKLDVKSTSGVIANLDGSGTTTGSADTGAALMFTGYDGSNARNFAQISGYKENSTGANYASYLAFSTRPNGGSITERARITSGGDLLVGTTNASASAGAGLKVLPAANGTDGPQIAIVTAASTNTTASLSLYSTGAAAYRFYVADGGTVYATSTSISGISDQRFKENIVDLDVGLNAVMALKPRKFDWKAGKGKDIKGDRGFIAQEFEQVFPDLIDEWKDPAPQGEEPYKSVRQDLIPVLVKAIQEQQALITSLTARVALLEGN